MHSGGQDGHQRVGVAAGLGQSGLRALKWLLDTEKALARGSGDGGAVTLVLVHIYQAVRWIPTPMGNKVPVSEVNEAIVESYRADKLKEAEDSVKPYRRLCQQKQVMAEEYLIAGDSTQKELVDQIFKLGLTKLVLGTSKANPFSRVLRGESIPEFVARHAPKFCTVMVIRNGKLFSVREASESLPSSTNNTEMDDTNNTPDDSSEDGSIRRYGVIHPLESASFAYSSPDRDPDVTMERLYSIPAGTRELNSAPGTPVHWLQNSSREDMASFKPTTEFEERKMVVSSLGKPEQAKESSSLPMPEASSSDSQVDLVSYPVIDLPDNVSSPGPPVEVNISQASLDLEPVQNPLFDEFPDEDLQVPLSVSNLLKNQLLDARRQIEKETASRAQILTDAENLANNANKKIRESERKRDEALKEAELARRRSVEDARRHEEAMAELERKASEERELLQQKISEYERMLAEERARSVEALQKLEALTKELERESQLRKEAEERASAESRAKDDALAALRKVQNSTRMVQRKYTSYSFDEIQKATDNFAETNKIGEGGYGPVFKGKLHHMTVAIKLLAHDGVHGREEFQREVEILGALHHPHMVMLLGACPEKGCIVYEYMANGSLADRLECKGGTPPLPWYLRFRICSEVATALLFLHSRPEPIVHRDLKPENILLDQNFVSKVSDVGIAKLVPSNNMTFSVTMYKETRLMGTMAYIDPDYQRTGVISCESDVYALGVVMLQILSGRPAVGVTELVENAIDNNSFHEVLDESAGDWPLEKAMELACLAVECTEPRRRNRPKLESKVLPILDKLRAYVDEEVASMAAAQGAGPVIPSFFFCPISQEIMEDPCIAADGYTYEREVVEQWLRGHDTSPMTNLRLDHKNVIPNYTVRSAIKEWMDK